MRKNRTINFFGNTKGIDFDIVTTGELNTTQPDLEIGDKQLSGGQNMVPASDSSVKKRDGIELYGNFLGNLSGIMGGFSFVGSNNTQEELTIYGTSLYRLVASVWTAITSVTMTINKPADGCYFPSQDKFYIVNQTDNVVKYTAGATSGVQTDSDFKKGKYIAPFQNRLLVANTSTNPNRVWYTDNQLDTFSADNWFEVDGEITGIIALIDRVLIFTKRKIWSLNNFYFDGTSTWAQNLVEIPTQFGAIYDRTISMVNNMVYFVGQDMNNVASIYVCDGLTAVSISYLKIFSTTENFNASELDHACSVADSYWYRLYVADGANSTNTLGIIYDTIKKQFFPVETKFKNSLSDFSCLWSSEISGVWTVFAGTQSLGQVYKLHANSGLYDELPEEKFIITNIASTYGEVDEPIDANPAKRAAQSFKMSNYDITKLEVPISKVALYLKKNSGTNTNLVVRIETDNAGKPSGTLAHANATSTILAANLTSSYAWITASFTPFDVTGNTTYWIVVQHATEGSGNSKYYWNANSAGTYANGNAATYASSTWTATANDGNFVLYNQSPIDGYADFKAFLPNDGREFTLNRFFTVFSQLGDYNVEVGLSDGSYGSYVTHVISISPTGGASYGSIADGGTGDTYGSLTEGGTGAIYGGAQVRKYQWTNTNGFSSRVLKLRVRNRNANQQFEFNKFKGIINSRFRNV